MVWQLKNQELEEHIITLRRDFHIHPELSRHEKRTSELVKKELTKLAIPFKEIVGGYGVVGILKGQADGPVIALRADMDALPISELTASSFQSKNSGVMHACGHDAHTAMLLGAAHLLKGHETDLEGTVLFIFQPAEEDSPSGGATDMMKDDIFQAYPPNIVIAQHVWPKLPVGEFGVMKGPIMGASDWFSISLKGVGGHASMPHQTTDVVPAINQLTSAIQSVVDRNVDPLESAVITIGKINVGYRYNVIAEEGEIEGTVRTFSKDVKKLIYQRLLNIVASIRQQTGAKAELNYIDGYPATINDSDTALFVKNCLEKHFGNQSCPEVSPSLAGEDFSRFLEKYPGNYYWLGVGGEKGDYPSLHDSNFKLDERALKVGYMAMEKIVLEYFNQQIRRS